MNSKMYATQLPTFETMFDETLKVHLAEWKPKIEERIKKFAHIDKVAKTCNFCNAHVEIEDFSEFGPRGYIVLEPSAEMCQEVDEIIQKRRGSGPHIYFNSGDDWRKYLLAKTELAPLKLSNNWGGYCSYGYDTYSKKVLIPIGECRLYDRY